MKMKKNLLMMGILIALIIDVSAIASTNLILNYDLTGLDADLKPGDSGILTVVIENTGGYDAEGVQVWITDNTDVHAAKRWDIGSIETGESKTMTATVNVDEDARVGLHTLQARITYDGTDTNGNSITDKTVSWDIPVRIYGKANFQFTVSESEYAEDLIGKLIVNVKPIVNARKVTSSLSSTCASIVGSGKQYIGDMSAESEYKLDYDVKPTENGICSLTLMLDYFDASGTEATENTTIGISVERSSIDLKVVDIEDGNLALGGVSDIVLKVKNLGNMPANDVTVTLNLSSPFTPVKSAQKYIGIILPDQTADVLFTISVDSSAKKKSYSIPVLIEYYDPSQTKQRSSVDIGLGVGGNADIKVNLDEKSVIMPGSSGKVTIGVVNRGFVDAKFLTLRLLSTGDYTVSSTDSSYIGALNSDDSDSQEFDIKVYGNVTSDSIPLLVRVEYKEENNDKLIVKDEEVNLGLVSKSDYANGQSSGGVLSMVLGLVGLVIVVIVGYLGIWTLARVLGIVTNTLDSKIFKRSKED